MTLHLEADGLAVLVLDRAGGFAVSTLDIGLPEIRAVERARADVDGVDDHTERHGAAAVSARILVKASASESVQERLDRLRGFCRPGLRAYLYFDAEDGTERRIRLRADQASSPWRMPGLREVQVGWRAPDGVQESAAEVTESVSAGSDVEAGITFPLVLPFTFAAGSSSGTATVTNDGNTSAYPVIRLYGPCTNPVIENETVGRSIVFGNADVGDLVLAAGEYVELDVRARTVLLDGETQSRHQYMDFVESGWWALEPGANAVRFAPESFEPGCAAVFIYRHTWI